MRCAELPARGNYTAASLQRRKSKVIFSVAHAQSIEVFGHLIWMEPYIVLSDLWVSWLDLIHWIGWDELCLPTVFVIPVLILKLGQGEKWCGGSRARELDWSSSSQPTYDKKLDDRNFITPENLRNKNKNGKRYCGNAAAYGTLHDVEQLCRDSRKSCTTLRGFDDARVAFWSGGLEI